VHRGPDFSGSRGSTVTAGTGDLDIYGNYGNVEVDNATLNATAGNIDIEAGWDDYAAETLTLNGDNITGLTISFYFSSF